MKHYLITGGAGFIGSNLIKTLFSHYPEIKVTCIDNFDKITANKTGAAGNEIMFHTIFGMRNDL